MVFKSNTLRVSTFINVYYHSMDNESPINYQMRSMAGHARSIGRILFVMRREEDGDLRGEERERGGGEEERERFAIASTDPATTRVNPRN